MSAISLRYSDVKRVPGVPVFRTILILSGLVTLTISLLAISISNQNHTGPEANLQSFTAPFAVPVPMPAASGDQPAPMERAAFHLEKTSELLIVPVAVPTPFVSPSGAQ